jgi:hypothetical protein
MISNNQATRTEVLSGTVLPDVGHSPARRSVPQPAPLPSAPSPSSYLNEHDRSYRAGATVESGGDIAERSVTRILRLDARLQEAQETGASPGALAAIERLREVYAQTSAMVVFDFGANPYQRW